MASPYQLANIMTGDPTSATQSNLNQALAYLEQYEKAKKQTSEINKVMRETEGKAGKGIGPNAIISGLLGLASGGASNLLLDKITGGKGIGKGGSGTGALLSILQGIMSAGGSHMMEKKRQKGITGKLKELKKKYKGTKQEAFIDKNLESLEKGLSDMAKSSAISSGMASAALPTTVGGGKATGGSKNLLDNIIQPATGGGIGDVQQTILDKIIPIPGIGEAFSDIQDKPIGQALSLALRLGYEPVMAEIAPEWISDRLYDPEFINPYG